MLEHSQIEGVLFGTEKKTSSVLHKDLLRRCQEWKSQHHIFWKRMHRSKKEQLIELVVRLIVANQCLIQANNALVIDTKCHLNHEDKKRKGGRKDGNKAMQKKSDQQREKLKTRVKNLMADGESSQKAMVRELEKKSCGYARSTLLNGGVLSKVIREIKAENKKI